MKKINLCKTSMLSKACSTPIAHTNPESFIAWGKRSEPHLKEAKDDSSP